MVQASGQKPTRTSGFTLVELLVVITIIGILMGLLIPAVNAAREAARRNQCSTQLNNLAKATIQYEMAKKQYPGWIHSFGQFPQAAPSPALSDPSDPDAAGTTTYAAHLKLGGWAVQLLPYLEAQPTYEIWTEDRYPIIGSNGYTKNAAPNLAILQCPSSTTVSGDRGRNSYISNNGYGLAFASGNPAAWLGSQKKANGVFNSKFGSGTTGPDVRADDLKDGAGNTVLKHSLGISLLQVRCRAMLRPRSLLLAIRAALVLHRLRDTLKVLSGTSEIPDRLLLLKFRTQSWQSMVHSLVKTSSELR